MVRASIVFVFPFQAFSLDVVTKGFDNILFAFDIELEKNGFFKKNLKVSDVLATCFEDSGSFLGFRFLKF